MPWASPHPRGTVITVWVGTRAPGTRLDGTHGDALRIRVAAPPEKGRANQELLDFLSASLEVGVELLSGSTSRRKRILVIDLDPDQVRGALAR